MTKLVVALAAMALALTTAPTAEAGLRRRAQIPDDPTSPSPVPLAAHCISILNDMAENCVFYAPWTELCDYWAKTDPFDPYNPSNWETPSASATPSPNQTPTATSSTSPSANPTVTANPTMPAYDNPGQQCQNKWDYFINWCKPMVERYIDGTWEAPMKSALCDIMPKRDCSPTPSPSVSATPSVSSTASATASYTATPSSTATPTFVGFVPPPMDDDGGGIGCPFGYCS